MKALVGMGRLRGRTFGGARALTASVQDQGSTASQSCRLLAITMEVVPASQGIDHPASLVAKARHRDH